MKTESALVKCHRIALLYTAAAKAVHDLGLDRHRRPPLPAHAIPPQQLQRNAKRKLYPEHDILVLFLVGIADPGGMIPGHNVARSPSELQEA